MSVYLYLIFQEELSSVSNKNYRLPKYTNLKLSYTFVLYINYRLKKDNCFNDKLLQNNCPRVHFIFLRLIHLNIVVE